MKLFFIIFICFNLSCCQNDNDGVVKQLDRIKSNKVNENHKKQINLIEYHRPILGYRFKIYGDYDGDGFQDTLIEHYQGKIPNVEINKYFRNYTDYWYFMEATIAKKPNSFLTSNNPNIDTLFLTKYLDNKFQHLGLSLLKNVGDLNGDGKDEICYVIKWADISNCNSLYIMSYINNNRKEIYSFSIWDFQIPDTPEIENIYWYFGLEKLVTLNEESSNNIENKIEQFEGLVKKVRDNLIQIEFRNEDAELDTAFIDIRTKKRINLLQIRN